MQLWNKQTTVRTGHKHRHIHEHVYGQTDCFHAYFTLMPGLFVCFRSFATVFISSHGWTVYSPTCLPDQLVKWLILTLTELVRAVPHNPLLSQCRSSFWQGLTADTSQKYGMACWPTSHTMSADNVGRHFGKDWQPTPAKSMVWLVSRKAIPCRPTMSVVILARTDSRHQPKVWYGLLADKPYHVGWQCRRHFGKEDWQPTQAKSMVWLFGRQAIPCRPTMSVMCSFVLAPEPHSPSYVANKMTSKWWPTLSTNNDGKCHVALS